MARKRKEPESQVEKEHGHCADLLMSDFGIPKERRKEICEEVSKIWMQISLIHDDIIKSVRGFMRRPQTAPLEALLERYATHEQRNSKSSLGRGRSIRSQEGYYDRQGFYHQAAYDPYEDF